MPDDHDERRGYLRFKVHLKKLQVTVAVLGFEPTNGVVLNISSGGMKVCLESEIHESLVGEDCLLRFVDRQGRVKPEAMLGKLRRMEGEGRYVIEFNEPLEGLYLGN